VKDAVPARIELQILDAVDRIPAAEHVVPLKQLVKNDSIEEATEAKPQEYASRNGELAVSR
jgi:hypothetical protein